MDPIDTSEFSPEDWLASLLQAWADSQQAIGLFDDQDRVQYANATYRAIFLDGQEGSFTLSELLCYGNDSSPDAQPPAV